MGDANRYEMILKKGNLQIELSSDDDYFMSKQLDRWFKSLMNAAPRSPSSAPIPERILPKAPEPEPEPEVIPEPVKVEIEPEPEPPPVELPRVKPLPEPEPEPVPEKPMVIEKIVISATSSPEPPPKPKPRPVAFIDAEVTPPPEIIETTEDDTVLDEEVKDDFEAVMASIKEDMDKTEDPDSEPDLPKFTVASPLITKVEPKKMDLEMMDSLTDLYERSNASSAEDILLLSSYFLTFCEREEKFSLRRINSMIVRSGLNPVTHSVIEGALEKGYLEMVPDMTGMAEVTEYCLTSNGPDSGKAVTERLL